MSDYIRKHAFLPKQIETVCSENTGICVVIPCYNEFELLKSLDSLFQCNRINCSVEVIIVVNSSENETTYVIDQNNITRINVKNWIEVHQTDWMQFFVIHAENLPHKHAGVGLARKIGMDEAVRRFNSINKRDGIIVCFDADSLCEKNYLQEIENHFHEYNPDASSIYFEHPLTGSTYTNEEYEAIVRYELFLRYYKQALSYCKLPFAYHTIGSSMAVRSDVYQAQGGMNKRKAGEDFYFLQKIIPLGNFTEINTTKVIPSPRISDRVPFGTGRTVGEIVASGDKGYLTYDFSIFLDLSEFVKIIPNLYTSENTSNLINTLPDSIRLFLLINNIQTIISDIKKNSSNQYQFEKRFYVWLNAFRILKYVHYARDNFYPLVELKNQCERLLGISEIYNTYHSLLSQYRILDLKS